MTEEPWLRFYAAGVPHRLHLPDVALPAFLHDAVRHHGRRTALVYQGRRTSYRSLHGAVCRFAAELQARGVRHGDRVGLALPNCPLAVVAWHAVLWLGAVVVPADPRLRAEELRQRMTDAGAVLTIDESCAPDAGRRGPGWRPNWSCGPGDPAVILYADGPPVTFTHRNLAAAANQLRAWHPGLRPGHETVLSTRPLSQPYGLLFGLLAPALIAARTVLLPTCDPEDALRAARRWKPTLVPGSGGDFRRLLSRPAHELEALATVRAFLAPAAGLDPEIADAFRSAVEAPLIEGYGTASAPVALANPLNANARMGTAGLPLPGTRVRIAAEADADASLGEAGELSISGPQVPGEGWLRTGALAVMSPDGYVTILGRAGAAARRSGRDALRR